jgi:hypothetical protein
MSKFVRGPARRPFIGIDRHGGRGKPTQSIEFRGVADNGWDIYEVRFANGVARYSIALSGSGTITGAHMTLR